MRPDHTRHVPAITAFAHGLLRQALREGDWAVDATAGNGHDTALLAHLVGAQGHVFAFDIQPQAIAATQARLQGLGLDQRVTAIPSGHEHMQDHVSRTVQAVVFNLGWLPGSDKTVTTRPDTTRAALNAAYALLQPHGVLVLTVYQGHSGAMQERDTVEAWVQQCDPARIKAMRYQTAHRVQEPPPYVLALEKMS